MDKNLISHEIELVKGENITVLKPIIDKLVLTITGNAALNIPDKAPLEKKQAKGYGFWTGMREALNLAANDPDAPEFSHLNKKMPRYKKAYEFKPHGQNQTIWLHTDPTSPKMAPLRLEFCP